MQHAIRIRQLECVSLALIIAQPVQARLHAKPASTQQHTTSTPTIIPASSFVRIPLDLSSERMLLAPFAWLALVIHSAFSAPLTQLEVVLVATLLWLLFQAESAQMQAVASAFILLEDAAKLATQIVSHAMVPLMETVLFVKVASLILQDIVLTSASILL